MEQISAAMAQRVGAPCEDVRHQTAYFYAGHVIRSEIDLPELPLGDPLCATGSSADPAPFLEIRCADFEMGRLPHAHRLIENSALEPTGAWFETSRLSDTYILRFPHVCEFRIRRHTGVEIDVIPFSKSAAGPTLRHLLLDHVLPRALAHASHLVLHAALVDVGGQGIGLVGPSGSGKSTLAAALSQEEARLLSDDGIVAIPGPSGVRASPTYPSLRLWPDSLAELYIVTPSTTVMTVASQKRRIALDKVQPAALPLSAIFMIRSGETETIEVSRQSVSEACMTLVSNAFKLDPASAAASLSCLETSRDVALRVPVFSLSYPRDFAQLVQVCRSIRSTLPKHSGCGHFCLI